jgi:ribosomal protein S12 methylthiotransferase
LGGGSVEIISLGCPKNLVDAERIAARLKAKGYKIVNRQGETILINTCSFITTARREARLVIRSALGRKRRGEAQKVVLAGCMVESHRQELQAQFNQIDGYISLTEIDRSAEIVAGEKNNDSQLTFRTISGPRELLTKPHLAYLKISEGCDNRCSYCRIPGIRGNYRSRELADVVTEAEGLAQTGVKELALVGEDTSRYGDDLSPRSSLAELLSRLNRIEGLRFIRLLYLSPNNISNDLLSAIANLTKVLPYMDIPLQYTGNNILADMHRQPLPVPIDRLVASWRKAIPGLTLRTTLMVGFPTETEKDFNMMLNQVKSGLFDYAGVFSYSPEESTPAYSLTPLPERIVQKRQELLLQAQERVTFARYRRMIGETIEVIVDDARIGSPSYLPPSGTALGRASFQAPQIDGVTWLSRKKGRFLEDGEIISARITSFRGFDLLAEVSL